MYALIIEIKKLLIRFVIEVKDQEFLKVFGKHVKSIRLKKKLTQEQLSYKANLQYSQISRIERGEINTTISTCKILAEALEIELKELFSF
jgi:transcriptional regulator with XRE-family HTH domain